MSQVNPSYVIGVIREKEKSFLEADEYVRIIEAPKPQDALQALIDTPYGRWIEQGGSLEQFLPALDLHLKEELQWLTKNVDNSEVRHFMTARFDALNIASALVQLKQQHPELILASPLGSLSQDALYTAIWQNASVASLGVWEEIVMQEKERIQLPEWKYSDLLARMTAHVTGVMHKLSRTPLMRELTQLYVHKLYIDSNIRQLPIPELPTALQKHTPDAAITTPAEILQQLLHWGYGQFTLPIMTSVVDGVDATAYERAWDAEIIEVLRGYRLGVSGYDPILAYWFGKQMESQNLRLLISGKLAGLSSEHLLALRRPYYQYSFV